MARKKISEYKAKQLLSQALDLSFAGEHIKQAVSDSQSHHLDSSLQHLSASQSYVVKVDQGVKGRFKKGLVAVDKRPQEISEIIHAWQEQGYSQFFIEPFIPHDASVEEYLSIERVRDGYKILYSKQGGIDIERNQSSIQACIIPFARHSMQHRGTSFTMDDLNDSSTPVEMPAEILVKLLSAFDRYYFSFLEINPLLIRDHQLYMLDAAVEVDSTAEFFVNGAWQTSDFAEDPHLSHTPEEEAINKLAETSQSALNLTVLNPNGSLFMLLSGGGASIVLADEAYNQGFGKEIANYGEYSGSPTTEETYLYTQQLLSLLFHSTAPKKALIIAGGVANFTDVRKTFKGIIQALEENKQQLQEHHVKIFVRRGGPHQKEGLALIRQFLENNGLLGAVEGPEMVLTKIIKLALASINK